MDNFDKVRTAIYQHKDKKCFCISGCLWRSSWTDCEGGVIPEKYEKNGFGHAIVLTGWKLINNEPYVVAQLSNGKEIGNLGNFYFSRNIINKEFTFGSFMMLDLDPDAVKKNNWNLWQKIYDFIIKKLSK